MSNTLSNIFFLSVFGVVLYFLLNNLVDRFIVWRNKRRKTEQNDAYVPPTHDTIPPSSKRGSSTPPELALRPDKKKLSRPKKVSQVESVVTPLGKDTGRHR